MLVPRVARSHFRCLAYPRNCLSYVPVLALMLFASIVLCGQLLPRPLRSRSGYRNRVNAAKANGAAAHSDAWRLDEIVAAHR